MREFWLFIAIALLSLVGAAFGLLTAHETSLQKATAPCKAAGGVIVLGPNKDWVCVAPIIIKPQHKVLL